MYDPDKIDLPPNVTQEELDRLPPHFAQTQIPRGDFSNFHETQFGNHGLHCHQIDETTLRKYYATYYGMISFMDHQIGRILDALDERGLTDNTLVVFSTDHGHFMGHHGLIAKGPFHFEDMLRLPFIVRWPGKVPAGKINTALQGLIDLSPTFLEAAGLKIPGEMQGVSQLPVWTGQKKSARDHVIVENRHQPTKLNLRTFINERWKLTIYRGHEFGELFDLQTDPNETKNLWADPNHAATKAQLMHRFLNAEMEREPTRMPRIAVA